uniref:Uncharacterized protein n=1 Tax=Arundo donax TaxID=35708 RepID=A0A0A9HJH2_ARUDO
MCLSSVAPDVCTPSIMHSCSRRLVAHNRTLTEHHLFDEWQMVVLSKLHTYTRAVEATAVCAGSCICTSRVN